MSNTVPILLKSNHPNVQFMANLKSPFHAITINKHLLYLIYFPATKSYLQTLTQVENIEHYSKPIFSRFLQSKLEEDLNFDDDEEDTKSTAVRKGLLWQQRDKLFSQWKERYFILTPDYLQCFKKGTSRMTEMGEFIFKVRSTFFPSFFISLFRKSGIALQILKTGSPRHYNASNLNRSVSKCAICQVCI